MEGVKSHLSENGKDLQNRHDDMSKANYSILVAWYSHVAWYYSHVAWYLHKLTRLVINKIYIFLSVFSKLCKINK